MHGPHVRSAWRWASWPWWTALKMACRTHALADTDIVKWPFKSFGRRSSAFRQPRQMLFTWRPMMSVKTVSTQARTAGYIWGFNQTNSSENEACCHTQYGRHAYKTLRLLLSFEKFSFSVACASSTQPIFKIEQPKAKRTLYSWTELFAMNPTNRATAQQSDHRWWGHMPDT